MPEEVIISFRESEAFRDGLKMAAIARKTTVKELIMEALASYLEDGELMAGSSSRSQIFAREMADFYSEVEGTPDEAFVEQIRDLAATIRRTRPQRPRQERKTA